MGDIENANELIDDLKDQIHDLEQDVKDLQKENDQLSKDAQEFIEEKVETDEVHEKIVKALEAGEDQKSNDIKALRQEISQLDISYGECYHNFIKALSIAETVELNGNTDYFKTDEGRILLSWAVNALKKEAHTMMKG